MNDTALNASRRKALFDVFAQYSKVQAVFVRFL